MLCNFKGMEVFWGNPSSPYFAELITDPAAGLQTRKEEREDAFGKNKDTLIINFFEVLKQHTVATA